MCSDGAEV
uniref:Uncharacterized protein n=1 Tax=Arundo donax TaxID=35708 RepID=A0A0A9A5G7_ARUDO